MVTVMARPDGGDTVHGSPGVEDLCVHIQRLDARPVASCHAR